jgi:putative membrane protein
VSAYVYMHDMGWGWGVLMTIGWIALLGLFVGVLVMAIRNRSGESAREILDRRLAAGEIDPDEYRRAREAMSEGHTGRPPTPPARA